MTKIYTDLCECCAKPKESCKRAGSDRRSQDSQTSAPSNRFAVLNLGSPNGDCPSKDRLPDRHRDEHTREDLATMPRGKAPRLTGDPLGDAFELRKEIQVHSPFIAIRFHADAESYRK